MNSEFVTTNKLAGYCSFDLIAGITRKYHGLVIAGSEDFSRRVVVATAAEFVELEGEGGKIYNISNNSYLGHKEAFVKKYLKNAYHLPYPTQELKLGNKVEIKRNYDFSERSNELVINYELSSPVPGKLTISPLYTLRDFHKLGLEVALPEVELIGKGNIQEISLDAEIYVELKSDLRFIPRRAVSESHYYKEETQRGYPDSEDLLEIGKLQTEFPRGRSKYYVRFRVIERAPIRKLLQFKRHFLSSNDNFSLLTDISRAKSVYPKGNPEQLEFLVYNARKFIVHDHSRHSVIAGYHWFDDWSRDTFISFKGLLLGLGRFHEAAAILKDWSNYISIGLLPNTMRGLHYNSIDGILLFIQSIWDYYQHCEDEALILELLPKAERALAALANGSKYGIHVDQNGFLGWSDEQAALTWMDAKVDGIPVTRRGDYPVEIQALWYNAIRIVEQLSAETSRQVVNPALLYELRTQLEHNFQKHYWQGEYLADYLSAELAANTDLRPNQLICLGLPFRLISKDEALKVLEVCEKRLLTDIGLKTLSENHPDYCGNYSGKQRERDNAYHQGTVWPWLLKPYFAALANYSPESNNVIRKQLDKSWEFITSNNLIGVPEIFSASNLQAAGTVNQAWSVAALLEGIMILNNK